MLFFWGFFLSCFLFSLSSCCVLYLMLNVFLVCPLLIALRFSPTFIYQAKYWACLLCKVAVVNHFPLCCLFMQLMKFCTRQPLSYLCSVNIIVSTFTKYSWDLCHVKKPPKNPTYNIKQSGWTQELANKDYKKYYIRVGHPWPYYVLF
jgi:hypothetical protein